MSQVNTHHHMFQCLTRCVAQDSYLFGWLSTCYSAWEQMKVSHALHAHAHQVQWEGAAADFTRMRQDLCSPGAKQPAWSRSCAIIRYHAIAFSFCRRGPLTDALTFAQSNDMFTACKLAMAELIMSGFTTSSDHLYIYPNDVTVGDSVRAAR